MDVEREIRCDVLVVGAGPAGCAAALELARRGLDVHVAEAKWFPRAKVCGEFLAAGAWRSLQALGVADAVRSSAVPIRELRVWLEPGRSIEVNLPVNGGPVGITRARLDALLAEAAARAGAKLSFGARVARTLVDGDRVKSVLADTTEGRVLYRPTWIVAADGRRSVLVRRTGRVLRSHGVGACAIQCHVSVAPAEWPAAIELYALANGYFGTAPVGAGLVNLCGLVLPAELRRHRSNVLAALDEQFRPWPRIQRLLRGRIRSVRAIADVAFQVAQPMCVNVLYAGDALATLEPATGQGMTAALLTGRWAAEEIWSGWRRRERQVQRRYVARWHERLSTKRRISRALGTTLGYAGALSRAMTCTANFFASASWILRGLYQAAQVS